MNLSTHVSLFRTAWDEDTSHEVDEYVFSVSIHYPHLNTHPLHPLPHPSPPHPPSCRCFLSKVGVEDAPGAQLKSNRWQRVAITIANDKIATYIDGEPCFDSASLPSDKDDRVSLELNLGVCCAVLCVLCCAVLYLCGAHYLFLCRNPELFEPIRETW